VGDPGPGGYRLVDNRDYPEIADDFARTFRILGALPCDVFLGAHGGYSGMVAKYERARRESGRNPFVDPEDRGPSHGCFPGARYCCQSRSSTSAAPPAILTSTSDVTAVDAGLISTVGIPDSRASSTSAAM
jgi:hypothetical protein